MLEKVIVQNDETRIEGEKTAPTPEAIRVCKEVAESVFNKVMQWHPLQSAAELAGNLLVAKMENDTFFETQLALTEKQQGHIKEVIAGVFREAAAASVAKVKNFEHLHEDFVGTAVISELVRIPEMTMAVIGEQVNRGALLAMTAVTATAKNEERDEITMWKSKHTGDITIPCRGVFISTNVLEALKDSINFRAIKEIDTQVS